MQWCAQDNDYTYKIFSSISTLSIKAGVHHNGYWRLKENLGSACPKKKKKKANFNAGAITGDCGPALLSTAGTHGHSRGIGHATSPAGDHTEEEAVKHFWEGDQKCSESKNIIF